MRNKFIFPSIIIIMTLVLAACAADSNPAENAPQTEANNNEEAPEPAAIEPTDEEIIPSVEVTDQEISNSSVIVPAVTTAQAGWVVIHTTTNEGSPGPVIGYAQVPTGSSSDVVVKIEADRVTPQLFAMLHMDAGEMGSYEFPGADSPVMNGDTVVMKPFSLSGLSASITVSDQKTTTDGTIYIDSAFMTQPGYVVIHTTTEEGTPGPVIGYTELPAGPSAEVAVSIDLPQATPQLFAMLHVDAGEIGTYEFPGDDVPVKNGDAVVLVPFSIEETSMDSAASSTINIDISNFAFTPNEIEIKVGTTVTWTNKDSAGHTATAVDGTFDSGAIRTDETFSFTFTEVGTFSYYCTFHPNMTASIAVVP